MSQKKDFSCYNNPLGKKKIELCIYILYMCRIHEDYAPTGFKDIFCMNLASRIFWLIFLKIGYIKVENQKISKWTGLTHSWSRNIQFTMKRFKLRRRNYWYSLAKLPNVRWRKWGLELVEGGKSKKWSNEVTG